jgi:hypothetical protein
MTDHHEYSSLARVTMLLEYNSILGETTVSSDMTKTRLKKIVENIHCNDNSKTADKDETENNNMYKIQPLVTVVNERIRDAYQPLSFVAAYKSIVQFKACLSLKKYIHLKHVKTGYTSWYLAHSQTGYIL